MQKKFIVGYNPLYRNQFTQAINNFKPFIKTVYTSFPGIANGRGNVPANLFQILLKDLKYYSTLDIEINLLINATCYGKQICFDSHLYSIIKNTIKALIHKQINITSITCINTIIANFIKQEFPEIKIICSINSDYYFIEQLNQIKNYYDGFYLNKSYNRNIQKIKEIYNWSKENNKQLFLLANSGCIKYCPELYQHMNSVSHIEQYNSYILPMDLACMRAFKQNKASILSNTTFYRPQDIHLIEPYFDGIKLATRDTFNVYNIIKAYSEQFYNGNLSNLLEPNYEINIPNKSIPSDWITKILSCSNNCSMCKFCQTTLNKII